MTWGPDLWDRYSPVVEYVTKGTNELVDVYAKFIKEKAELEKEYAKTLRKLVVKYEPKKIKIKKNNEDEESTEYSSFRTFLAETGYQAGQHELLAEHLSKVLVKEIQNKSAEAQKKVKDNSKEAKREKERIEASYFNLEKAKLKYQKSFHDWKESDRDYQIADQDGTISRNEILKMKHQTQAKQKLFEDSKAKYIEQLDKTNVEQREYFDYRLPEMVNRLQDVDRERIEFVRRVLERSVAGEKEMATMVNKCREGVEEAVASISVEKDQQILKERYKTGDLPPTDIQFEEMSLGREKKSRSLTRRMSRSNFSQKTDKQNLFQKKRKLLSNIEKYKSDISKGTKEKQALQLMIDTYTKTPEFGDASKFQQELDIVSQKVEKLSQELSILNRDLDLVESKMNLNMRHSLLATPSRSLLSMNTSSSSSTGSDKSDDQEGDNHEIHGDDIKVIAEESLLSPLEKHECLEICSDTIDHSSVMKSDISEEFNEVNSEDRNIVLDAWDDDFEDAYPESSYQTIIALYSYDGAEEGTLSMNVGDEFEVQGVDIDGWIKVKRRGFIEEGFIPFAFTKLL
eukprot:GFUD01033867.1.p1 GENE.GFUD01033867.1~~GFUD01033867.1.p1  ORF type:complete len:570 (+),score=214.86 GFUD01033867.1:46-1755(+)